MIDQTRTIFALAHDDAVKQGERHAIPAGIFARQFRQSGLFGQTKPGHLFLFPPGRLGGINRGIISGIIGRIIGGACGTTFNCAGGLRGRNRLRLWRVSLGAAGLILRLRRIPWARRRVRRLRLCLRLCGFLGAFPTARVRRPGIPGAARKGDVWPARRKPFRDRPRQSGDEEETRRFFGSCRVFAAEKKTALGKAGGLLPLYLCATKTGADRSSSTLPSGCGIRPFPIHAILREKAGRSCASSFQERQQSRTGEPIDDASDRRADDVSGLPEIDHASMARSGVKKIIVERTIRPRFGDRRQFFRPGTVHEDHAQQGMGRILQTHWAFATARTPPGRERNEFRQQPFVVRREMQRRIGEDQIDRFRRRPFGQILAMKRAAGRTFGRRPQLFSTYPRPNYSAPRNETPAAPRYCPPASESTIFRAAEAGMRAGEDRAPPVALAFEFR